MKKNVYAVVDIETTGTNVEQGGKMIQFACCLIEAGAVVHQFSTFINPGIKIPEQITRLTGIKQQDVANEPYFEDVAPVIYGLLTDCIFVAHNVHFDYQFLLSEFNHCGYTDFRLTGMDTVELSQILLPTEMSYRLSDLAESLQLEHENPHRADSDAYVTAELFLYLQEKAASLPLVTIEKLVVFSEYLMMDTGLFFVHILEEMKHWVPPLDPAIQVKNGIAIQKQQVFNSQQEYRLNAQYPETRAEKVTLFQSSYQLREAQEKMMNKIHQVLEGEPHHLAIEAPTGIGKTFGYLLPLAYHAKKNAPIVVSTYTNLLQYQLFYQDIAKLKDILPFELQVALIKGRNHYLHLSKFEHILKEPNENKNDALLKMQVLVWLTATKTGDLDELHLASNHHSFWQRIKHNGWVLNSQKDEWFAEDFYLLAQKRSQQADLIITNHSVLCQNLRTKRQLLPDFEYLMVDEAHHLHDMAMLSSEAQFSYQQGKYLMQAFGHIHLPHTLLSQLQKIMKDLKISQHLLMDFDISLLFIEEKLAEIFEGLVQLNQLEHGTILSAQDHIHVLFDQNEVEKLSPAVQRGIQECVQTFAEATEQSRELITLFQTHEQQLTKADLFMIESFGSLSDDFQEYHGQLSQFFDFATVGQVKWLEMSRKNPKGSLQLKMSAPEVHSFLKKELVEKVPYLFYTGGTLSIGQSFEFFKAEVGETEALETTILESNFDYSKQAKLVIPKEFPAIKTLSQQKYTQLVVKALKKIAKGTDKNVLVLFNSLEMLKHTYQQLNESPLFSKKELMAQGISGSRERLLKRFYHSKGSMLLGSESFWEGVDLPGSALEILVIVRLPFESPAQPLVKARYERLEAEGHLPFKEDALPRAALRLRQGLGRLIRSETDKGMMILLDNRLTDTDYGHFILEALPEDLPKEKQFLSDIVEEIHDFLN
ncbi:ATP-dependent DNA helicase DinG [Isobaculum melis]|uniref:3'-5' exonuclease DinG n=1 Tax=Isobaculum melis TaxID=142588 RepID=A0A1H9R954_9LACT|nr:ATP-dependent DNA helicase DinG [Isobaculum melis]SER69137.1 ATP-dependent DNA helicase DinG [Isobaculum melis]